MADTEVLHLLRLEGEEEEGEEKREAADAVDSSEDKKAAPPVPATMISLRKLELSDLDDFMVWASDERVTRFCTWDAYTSKEDLLKFMTETALPHPWFKVICVDGRAVGSISVMTHSGIFDRCRVTLAYALAFDYWGRGVMTQVVRLVTASVFKEMPWVERVEALVDMENVGSQRVLQKAGFQREGVLRKYFFFKGRTRDIGIYSLLTTDQPPIDIQPEDVCNSPENGSSV